MKRIVLVCPTEKTILGWLNVEPGQAITVDKLGRDFEPKDGPAVRAALVENVEDGQTLLCPTCRNAVAAAPADQDLDEAIKSGATVQLGATKVK